MNFLQVSLIISLIVVLCYLIICIIKNGQIVIPSTPKPGLRKPIIEWSSESDDKNKSKGKDKGKEKKDTTDRAPNAPKILKKCITLQCPTCPVPKCPPCPPPERCPPCVQPECPPCPKKCCPPCPPCPTMTATGIKKRCCREITGDCGCKY